MKEFFTYLSALLLATIIIGCSSKKNEVEVKPLDTKVKGDIGSLIEVVDGSYKIVKSSQIGNDWEITFKLKNVNNSFTQVIDAINNGDTEIDFRLSLTDANGKPISGIKDFWMADGLVNNYSELEKLKALLKESPGSEEWFTLATDVDMGSNYEEKLPEGIAKFVVRTITKQKEESSSSYSSITDSQNDDSYNTESTGSGDCDEALTEYESFVDEYIEFAERASEGDYSVMSKAASLMQKAESAGRKIQNLGQAQLGSSCWDKYISIQQKLSEAALRISKNMPKNMNNLQGQMEDLQNSIGD